MDVTDCTVLMKSEAMFANRIPFSVQIAGVALVAYKEVQPLRHHRSISC